MGGGLERIYDFFNVNLKLLVYYFLEKEYFYDFGDNFLLENDDFFYKVVFIRSLDIWFDMEFKEIFFFIESIF